MIEFILNNRDISTDLPSGMTVLDFVRYRQNLKGTKIGCREGDCGACTILVGELIDETVRYRSMTSCLMPLANAAGKHVVTIEGINPSDGSLTPVQQAMVDENGTQCGFCTVGFVMSLTGHCLESVGSSHVSKGSFSPTDAAISAIDGNICRCTGYKSIERAAVKISAHMNDTPPYKGGVDAALSGRGGSLRSAIDKMAVPDYFSDIAERLGKIAGVYRWDEAGVQKAFVGGGTDTYVQKPEFFAESDSEHLFYNDDLRGFRDLGDYIEIGASATVTDLLESPVMNAIFPDLYKHLKLVSSTPIRNMATLAGNFVNASPIGDMTVWFLALDASILISSPPSEGGVAEGRGGSLVREIPLADFYLGYKQLAKADDEIVTAVRFKKPFGDFRFNFEKVCKRTYLDIASVNTAISLKLYDAGPPVPSVLLSEIATPKPRIQTAHVAAGGVAPIPLYLRKTSAFLIDKEVSQETINLAAEIIQDEISPISDVRGSEDYKRLLLRQLFRAHFGELFATELTEKKAL